MTRDISGRDSGLAVRADDIVVTFRDGRDDPISQSVTDIVRTLFTQALEDKLTGVEAGAQVNLAGGALQAEIDRAVGNTIWRSAHTVLRTATQTRDLLATILGANWWQGPGGGTGITLDEAIDGVGAVLAMLDEVGYDPATNTFTFALKANSVTAAQARADTDAHKAEWRERIGAAAAATSGQTPEQVRDLIKTALDAFLGDEQEDIDTRAAGRSYDAARGDDSVLPATVTTGSLLADALGGAYALPQTLRASAAGGEALTLELAVDHRPGVRSGAQPTVELRVTLSAAGTAFGDTITATIPEGVSAFPVSIRLPDAWLAEGDPAGQNSALSIAVVAHASSRGRRSSGTVVLRDAAIHALGSHQSEVTGLINGLIRTYVDPIEAMLAETDGDLRSAIAAAQRDLVTSTWRRILGLFTLLQNETFSTYAVAYRDGTEGAFGAPADSITPTGATLDVSLPIPEALQYAADLYLRQADATGALQDAPFSQHAHASDHDTFQYRFAVRAGAEAHVVRLVRTDTLQIFESVRDLEQRLGGLAGKLSPAALALLGDVQTATISTRAIARTTLLPALTAQRRALAGAIDPRTSPAISGGEHIIAIGGGTATGSRVEAYLSDIARIDLLRVDPIRGVPRITIPRLVPEQPARTAQERVYLRDARGDDIREFRVALTAGPDIQDVSGEFALPVPADIAAGTQVTVSERRFANDNPDGVNNQQVAIGGAVSGAVATYVYSHWTIRAQYRVLASGNRYLVYSWTRDPNLIHGAERHILVSASYIAERQVAAVPASIGREVIYQGASLATYHAVVGLKIKGGQIVFTLEDAPGSGFAEGEYETGLLASTYGLEAGGTGVLRYRDSPYRELVRVTAGDVTADAITQLRRHVDAQEFGAGLFSQADVEDQAFVFDRAIQAPAFYSRSMVAGKPASVGRSVFVADSALVSYDPGGHFIRISAPDIPDAKDVVVFFQCSRGVLNAIAAEPDNQQIGIRLGDSTVTRLFRRTENGATVNMTAGRFPAAPVRYVAQTAGGNVNVFVIEEQVDFGARLKQYDATDTYTAGDVVVLPADVTPSTVTGVAGVVYLQGVVTG